MRIILLNKNLSALVDDEDFEWLSEYRWYAVEYSRVKNRFYAKMSSRRKTLMHRLLLNAPRELEVDHMNGNTLDNRKSNLRLATRSENARNCLVRIDSKARFKGVEYRQDKGKYSAYYTLNGEKHHIGYFDDALSASEAHKKSFSEALGLPYEEICPRSVLSTS